MCTGFSTEASQNDLYLKTRELGGKFFRDKDSNKYNVQTTHLLVGVIAKSEKFLSALAAGIPMLDVSFLKDVECFSKKLVCFFMMKNHEGNF